MAFRKADLLLSLCLVSAILLNVYAAVDPTGVYRRYLEKLAPMTPPVAAMATAGGGHGHSPGRRSVSLEHTARQWPGTSAYASAAAGANSGA